MSIDDMKREMRNDFGFNEAQIDRALEIISFIGISQDLAWRQGEGVLQEDIQIGDDLFNFLKQGYIISTSSKYKYYSVYLLDDNGQLIFQELLKIKKNEKLNSIQEFKKEFKEKNLNILRLLMLSKKIDNIDVKNDNMILFSNSKKGVQLKEESYKKIDFLKGLFLKYKFFIDITEFQSNSRSYNKSRFIISTKIYQFLADFIESFSREYGVSITQLNNKVSFFEKIMNSIRNYNLRNEIYNEYPEYNEDYKQIIKGLKKENITTSFNPSKLPCFKIIDEQEFKRKIKSIQREYINKISDPIIDNLLSEDNQKKDHAIYEKKENQKNKGRESVIDL